MNASDGERARPDVTAGPQGADKRSDMSVEDSRPAFDVDAIMWQVHTEVTRRGLAAETERMGSGAASTLPPGVRWRPVAARLPDKDRYALIDFLGFDDHDFVDVAYRKLLQRPANDDGSKDYLEALRRGAIGKIEILGMIRYSAEGSRHGVPVDGLLLRYRVRRWRRMPGVGWFVGMGMALAGLPRLALRLRAMEASAAYEAHEIGRLLNHAAAATERNARSLADRADLLHSLDSRVHTLHEKIGSTEEALREKIGSMEEVSRASNAERAAHQNKTDDLLAAHSAALARLNDRTLDDQRNLRAMLERLTVFLDVAVRQQSLGAANQKAVAEPSALETQYASFEQAFRGERGEIKQRVSYYLDTLAAAGIKPDDDGMILDLGSGRGEWLEVLAENGYHGRGVDLNRGMLNESEARGHDVVEADVLDYLRAQDSDSFAAITSMHLVEHIPHPTLIQLLDEALRVLRPGGVLILETPNPENVLVGSCMFYMDPTHLNPIPPLLLQWTVQTRGFEQTVIERLSEHRGEPALVPVPDDVPGAPQINQIIERFTAPPDYAVIARKPAASPSST